MPDDKKKTPNCTTCKWKHDTVYMCTAQANKWCDQVYDNDNCKSLYKPK